jgi:serine phosphatase RsbU (regulator of sigma subunit)
LEKEIQELNNLKRKTHQDSMLLLQKSVSIQQQLVNNEKYQLQVDRLNARSKEDSSLILEREKRILFADQAIANAQNRIKLKNFEIKNQRIILISSISGLVLTLVLFIILFTSFRQKKKFSKQLERQNRELEIQGQGLEKANYLLSMQNLEITASINYAKRIQEAILPAAKKVKDHFEDYFLIYKPKDIVSGDFYWMERMDNKIYFALIDCTGHGVPGAFMSIIGNRLFNEVFFTKKITDPAQFLEALDIGIKEILRQEVTENNDGMDVCFCCFERIEDNKLKVRFAGAKRPLFYYMTDKDEIALLKGDRKPIGGKYYHDVIFTNKEIILTKGDVLYLTSDGYTDQNGPEMKKLGTKRLVDILKENATKPMSVQKKALETELDTHQEGEDQRDDITIIGIKL